MNKLISCLLQPILSLLSLIYTSIKLIITKAKWKTKSSEGKVTDITPVSMLEVKVTLPIKLIFEDETIAGKYDPTELAQSPKILLGEGTLGTLYKVILNCGSIVTVRVIRQGLANPINFELWTSFFGVIRNAYLLPLQFGFWYGGQAFLVYEYLCLGSLEELLHGSEGIQFTPLNWETRRHIALCVAMGVAFLHNHVTKKGNTIVCGVIKASNILIRTDCRACLCGYEAPYLLAPAIIIRRNPGRVAPELTSNQHYPKTFTPQSDVYSFGIFLLELVTGKRSIVTNLGEYVVEKRKREGLRGILDPKLGDLKESMREVIAIAESCLSDNPKKRPSMETVVQMLQQMED